MANIAKEQPNQTSLGTFTLFIDQKMEKVSSQGEGVR